MVVLYIRVPFGAFLVRVPYYGIPKKEPNLENYPSMGGFVMGCV